MRWINFYWQRDRETKICKTEREKGRGIDGQADRDRERETNTENIKLVHQDEQVRWIHFYWQRERDKDTRQIGRKGEA